MGRLILSSGPDKAGVWITFFRADWKVASLANKTPEPLTQTRRLCGPALRRGRGKVAALKLNIFGVFSVRGYARSRGEKRSWMPIIWAGAV
jgi:hypothetical protein